MSVSVQPTAQLVRAYIGLGSNLDEPLAQVRAALSALADMPHSHLIAHSGLYRSKPLAGMDQPDFINAVAVLDTGLEAAALLNALQAIELKQGRVRGGERWAARTLDLDILLYGEQHITTDHLQVPHPQMALRAFVLYPMQEVTAALGDSIAVPLRQWLDACPAQDLQRVADA